MDLSGKWKFYSLECVPKDLDYNLFDNSIFYPTFQLKSTYIFNIYKRKEIMEENVMMNILLDGKMVQQEVFSLGLFNHKYDDSGNVIMTVVQNCNKKFNQFSLMHLGPRPNESSCEHYILNEKKLLQVVIVAANAQGENFTINLLFSRNDSFHYVPFENYSKTLGWDALKYWPPRVLDICKIKVDSSVNLQITKPDLDPSLWSAVDLTHLVTDNIADEHSDSKLEFKIEVMIGSRLWFTSRSYDDMKALNEFIIHQNIDSNLISPFRELPSQSNLSNDRFIVFIERLFNSYIKNSKFINQNSVDAICSFLEIPEHMSVEQKEYLERLIEAPVIDKHLSQYRSFRLDKLTPLIQRQPSVEMIESLTEFERPNTYFSDSDDDSDASSSDDEVGSHTSVHSHSLSQITLMSKSGSFYDNVHVSPTRLGLAPTISFDASDPNQNANIESLTSKSFDFPYQSNSLEMFSNPFNSSNTMPQIEQASCASNDSAFSELDPTMFISESVEDFSNIKNNDYGIPLREPQLFLPVTPQSAISNDYSQSQNPEFSPINITPDNQSNILDTYSPVDENLIIENNLGFQVENQNSPQNTEEKNSNIEKNFNIQTDNQNLSELSEDPTTELPPNGFSDPTCPEVLIIENLKDMHVSEFPNQQNNSINQQNNSIVDQNIHMQTPNLIDDAKKLSINVTPLSTISTDKVSTPHLTQQTSKQLGNSDINSPIVSNRNPMMANNTSPVRDVSFLPQTNGYITPTSNLSAIYSGRQFSNMNPLALQARARRESLSATHVSTTPTIPDQPLITQIQDTAYTSVTSEKSEDLSPSYNKMTPISPPKIIVSPLKPNETYQNTVLNASSPPQSSNFARVDSFNPYDLKSFSNDGGDFSEIYHTGSFQETPPNLKYMPVEMVSSPTMKKSIAKSLLYGVLKSGLKFIKHGRHGKPKRKILTCDPSVSILFWLPEESNSTSSKKAKFIKTKDIKGIRLGTDIDPTTSLTALEKAKSDGRYEKEKVKDAIGLKTKMHSNSDQEGFFSKLFGHHDSILFGTQVLRKNCKPEDLSLCISLILDKRTFDIQCLSKKDFELLSINLKELVNFNSIFSVLSRSDSSDNIEPEPSVLNENPLAKSATPAKSTPSKKSVRFIASFSMDEKDGPREDTPGIPLRSALRQPKSYNSIGTDEQVMQLDTNEENLDLLISKDFDGPLALPIQGESKSPTFNRADSFDDSRPKQTHFGMSSNEALQIGLILSEQERKYGTNMYLSLRPEDEDIISNFVKAGYTTEEAVLKIFEDRFVVKSNNLPKTTSLESISKCNSSEGFGRKSSFVPEIKISDSDSPIPSPVPGPNFTTISRLSSTDALQIGLLLSQQEQEYGVNMYEILKPEDEEFIASMQIKGSSRTDALIQLFNTRIVLPHNEHLLSTKQISPHSPPTPVINIPQSGSTFFPNSPSLIPQTQPQHISTVPKRISSAECMDLAILLSEQEARFGINMYDSLTPADEPEIQSLVANGLTLEQAIYALFDRKFINPTPVKTILDENIPMRTPSFHLNDKKVSFPNPSNPITPITLQTNNSLNVSDSKVDNVEDQIKLLQLQYQERLTQILFPNPISANNVPIANNSIPQTQNSNIVNLQNLNPSIVHPQNQSISLDNSKIFSKAPTPESKTSFQNEQFKGGKIPYLLPIAPVASLDLVFQSNQALIDTQIQSQMQPQTQMQTQAQMQPQTQNSQTQLQAQTQTQMQPQIQNSQTQLQAQMQTQPQTASSLIKGQISLEGHGSLSPSELITQPQRLDPSQPQVPTLIPINSPSLVQAINQPDSKKMLNIDSQYQIPLISTPSSPIQTDRDMNSPWSSTLSMQDHQNHFFPNISYSNSLQSFSNEQQMGLFQQQQQQQQLQTGTQATISSTQLLPQTLPIPPELQIQMVNQHLLQMPGQLTPEQQIFFMQQQLQQQQQQLQYFMLQSQYNQAAMDPQLYWQNQQIYNHPTGYGSSFIPESPSQVHVDSSPSTSRKPKSTPNNLSRTPSAIAVPLSRNPSQSYQKPPAKKKSLFFMKSSTFRDSDLRTITSMGFTKEQAISALSSNGNDLNRAIDFLCRHSNI